MLRRQWLWQRGGGGAMMTTMIPAPATTEKRRKEAVAVAVVMAMTTVQCLAHITARAGMMPAPVAAGMTLPMAQNNNQQTTWLNK